MDHGYYAVQVISRCKKIDLIMHEEWVDTEEDARKKVKELRNCLRRGIIEGDTIRVLSIDGELVSAA